MGRGTFVALRPEPLMRSSRASSLIAALVSGVAAVCVGPAAQAQGVDARTTGIFLRAGATVSGFGLDAMTFRAQGRRGDLEGSFTGKQLSLGRAWLPGVSVGAHVDGQWFYVRVGADLYQDPSPGTAEFSVHSTTLGWIAAGPRFVFGSFALLAGLRVAALLMDVERRVPADMSSTRERSQQYSGLGALYAVDVGAQWRPARWFQLDVSAGQDLLGPLTATTFSLTASVGWTRAPQR